MFRSTVLFLAALMLFACQNGSTTSQPIVEATPTAKSEPDKPKTTSFDAERAFNNVKTQVEFGPRPAGSPAIEKTREFLVKELKSYGLTPTLDEFTDTTPHGKTKFKNVIAELPGDSPNTIIISSHYDTKEFKEFKFVGANDGGSSTGILLEIARVMAADKQKRKFTYQFVFFDGEEAFCHEWSECLNGKDNTYGSRHYVEKLKKEKQTDRIKAMILLDMVGDKDLVIPREENSSAWLVNAIWDTAREIGHAKHFPSRTQYTTDDHIAFLQASIPAVDLIDFEYGGADSPYWHTAEDTLDKISAQSLKVVGDVILLSLPKIEAQIR
ncbi:MAG: M28 family peptidase [Acidobacteria bacterium]|nr:M28 family peptidase [Acidobacteriota bacterium]